MLTPPKVSPILIRSTRRSDATFLSTLFSQSRKEFEYFPQELIRLQELAQRRHFTKLFGLAGESILEVNKLTAGRIWIAWSPESVRLVDISLLSEFRHRGIGTFLLTGLCDAADSQGLSLELSVAKDNKVAQAMYASCDFRSAAKDDDGPYLSLVRRPSGIT